MFTENDLLDIELDFKHQEVVMDMVRAIRELTAENVALEERLKEAQDQVEHVKWTRCAGLDCRHVN